MYASDPVGVCEGVDFGAGVDRLVSLDKASRSQPERILPRENLYLVISAVFATGVYAGVLLFVAHVAITQ